MTPATTFWVFLNGKWIGYSPLEGIDPSFTESKLRVGAVAYAMALSEGKNQLDAHCSAESVIFGKHHKP
jgi:hypothetical protein